MIVSISVIDYKNYSLEHLTDSVENLNLISDFTVSNNAYGLENYLKKCALHDEKHNYARTYLVKDKFTGELAAYFSLRSGLITTELENSDIGKFNTLPAIELSNFAVNDGYKKKHPKISELGFIVFKFLILPLVKEMQKYNGINSLYIYALPNDKLIDWYEKLGFKRLPADKEKFVYAHIKPKYDEGCIFMSQTV